MTPDRPPTLRGLFNLDPPEKWLSPLQSGHYASRDDRKLNRDTDFSNDAKAAGPPANEGSGHGLVRSRWSLIKTCSHHATHPTAEDSKSGQHRWWFRGCVRLHQLSTWMCRCVKPRWRGVIELAAARMLSDMFARI